MKSVHIRTSLVTRKTERGGTLTIISCHIPRSTAWIAGAPE